MKLILASNSPRRRELLAKLNYQFEIIPSNCEEITASVKPTDIVQDLATLKAREVFASHPDCVVLGCDTVVDFNGEIMGKPKNHADASRMLHALSGNTHYVHTGVCILSPVGEWLFCDSTKVVFRSLSERKLAITLTAVKRTARQARTEFRTTAVLRLVTKEISTTSWDFPPTVSRKYWTKYTKGVESPCIAYTFNNVLQQGGHGHNYGKLRIGF